MRIFNTYGPAMSPNDGRVISNFIVQALRNEDITLFGDGSQTRSFVYIDDLLDGLLCMMENTSDFVGPVNMGNPNEITIRTLAETVLAMIPESRSRLVFKPLPGDDPLRRCPDIGLARDRLGWQPATSLAAGLQQTVAYFRSLLGQGRPG